MVALASDPKVHSKSREVYGTWTVAKGYRFNDRDGSQSDWGRVFDEEIRNGSAG